MRLAVNQDVVFFFFSSFFSFFGRTPCASEADWSARRARGNWKVAVFALYQTLIHPANPGRAPLSDSRMKPPS